MFPTAVADNEQVAIFTNNSPAGTVYGILIIGELLTSKYCNDVGKVGASHEVNSGQRAIDIEMRLSDKP